MLKAVFVHRASAWLRVALVLLFSAGNFVCTVGVIGTAKGGPPEVGPEPSVLRDGSSLFLRLFRADGADGLGPYYQRAACASCHFGLGQGQTKLSFLALFRPGYPGERVYIHAIRGTPPPPRPQVWRRVIRVVSPGGVLALSRRVFRDGEGRALAARRAMNLVAAGWIEPVGAGGQRPAKGRFGWDARQATLEGQIQDAFALEMGVTAAELDAATNAAPDVPASGAVESLAAFIRDQARRAAFPAHGNDQNGPQAPLAPSELRGAALFRVLGCQACHVPNPEEAAPGAPPLWSDLRLHNMGNGLADPPADRIGKGGATRNANFRTAPLIGNTSPMALALGQTAPQDRRWLHDGRARSLAEAIAWHGGEAAESRAEFLALGRRERADLIAWLTRVSGAP